MAIMYFQVTPISRSQGRSAVAAAAYRAGERLRDARTGKLHNYSRRDDVTHKEILLPAGLNTERVSWVKDRVQLWNSAERAEHQRNSRIAREFQLGLPHELSAEQRHQLARAFSQELSDRYRVVVDLAVHLPRPQGDPRNFHAHLMLSSREITADGFRGKAGLDMQPGEMRKRGLREGIAEIKFMRERWATLTNEALRSANIDVRLDHRTLAAQGIDRLPRARVPWSTVMRERKGLRSEIGERVRANHLARVQAKRQRQLDRAAGRDSVRPQLKEDAKRVAAPEPVNQPQTPTVEDLQRQAREAWLQLRRGAENAPTSNPPGDRPHDRSNERSPKPPSVDDDLSL
jgi:ATP-dependent exoDNAse (exonuclease V) alpha subunit